MYFQSFQEQIFVSQIHVSTALVSLIAQTTHASVRTDSLVQTAEQVAMLLNQDYIYKKKPVSIIHL